MGGLTLQSVEDGNEAVEMPEDDGTETHHAALELELEHFCMDILQHPINSTGIPNCSSIKHIK